MPPNMTFGVIRFSSTGSCTLTSGGGNNIGSTWVTRPSAGTITPYGFDIQDDVTKWVRTSGAFGYNTNAAPGSGTLTGSGMVMCQGVASGSWFLMANPLGAVF